MNIFGLTYRQCYGNDDSKNELVDCYWPDTDKRMTAREVMQYVGTDVFRKIQHDVWAGATIKKIDLETYRFSVITFETDAYQGCTDIVEESRNILQRHNYQLVASNVQNCGHAFEDWYVDPNIVTEDVWTALQSDNIESSQILHS